MHNRLREFSGFAIILLLSGCGSGSTTATGVVIGSVTTVAVSGPSTTVILGSTLQLTAAPTDANGNAITGQSATWTSSNQSVATVSQSGLVSGLTFGSVTITATISGVPGTAALSVAPAPAAATVQANTSLQFVPGQADITAGGTVTWQFQATAHNVTFTTSATGTPTNISDIASTSVARTFTTAGTFAYHCTIHAGMNGTVVVH